MDGRRSAPSLPEERHNAGDDSGYADEAGDEGGAGKEFFGSDDERDGNHGERIHDAEGELDGHGRDTTDATSDALFAAEAKAGFILRA